MKALERIFLYSILAILVFYVFLVDNNVESQGAIQEVIYARRIVIVNDEGREAVMLSADKHGGLMSIYNNYNIPAVLMGANKYGGVMTIVNKDGNGVAGMGADDDGRINIFDKDGYTVAGMGVNEDGNGAIEVYNKDGKVIGSLP